MSREQPSIPLNLAPSIQENPLQTVSLLELINQNPIPSSTMMTGNNESNLVLIPSEHPSNHNNEIHSVKISSNLKSHASPQEILEKLPSEPKILKISKEDFAALCQVINEFKDQFIH
jgi:hypothetical protein